MNQNPQYANTYCILALRRHLLISAGAEEKAFTEKEKRLYKILSQTRGETLISISIRTRLADGSLGSFREMIKELSDQKRDAPNELIKAIGIESVNLIEEIINDLMTS